MTDDVTVTSLCASLIQMIRAATDRLCQIALNRKLLRKFEKWCKFSSYVKAKLCKTNPHKMRPASVL
jgi:hypothetical protein